MSGGKLLTLEEQIQHLKDKGIVFEKYPEFKAKIFPQQHSYLTKVSSYRKNYSKHPAGPNKGKYVKLDFAYLVELSTIDMHMRYLIIKMCLDIEHALKISLLNDIQENPDEDGYSIVTKFCETYQDFLDSTHRRMNNSYCHDLFFNNEDNLPIWVLLEVISFGDLIKLYKLYYRIYDDRVALFNAKLLDNVRCIRNASAHSNCLLCELNRQGNLNKVLLTEASTLFPWMSPSNRRKYMRKQFTQDFTVLLMAHRQLVRSVGIHNATRRELLQLFVKRMLRHRDYFKENPVITGAYLYCLKLVLKYYK